MIVIVITVTNVTATAIIIFNTVIVFKRAVGSMRFAPMLFEPGTP